MNVLQIAREIFTDVSEDEEGDRFLGYVLWNWTGYPCFWTGDPETDLRKQLTAYRDDPKGVEAAYEKDLDEMLVEAKKRRENHS